MDLEFFCLFSSLFTRTSLCYEDSDRGLLYLLCETWYEWSAEDLFLVEVHQEVVSTWISRSVVFEGCFAEFLCAGLGEPEWYAPDYVFTLSWYSDVFDLVAVEYVCCLVLPCLDADLELAGCCCHAHCGCDVNTG